MNKQNLIHLDGYLFTSVSIIVWFVKPKLESPLIFSNYLKFRRLTLLIST